MKYKREERATLMLCHSENWCCNNDGNMCVWLGHACSTGAALIATSQGVINTCRIRRLPECQQWEGQRIVAIKGSPNNWRLDAGADRQQAQMRDGGIVPSFPEVSTNCGSAIAPTRMPCLCKTLSRKMIMTSLPFLSRWGGRRSLGRQYTRWMWRRPQDSVRYPARCPWIQIIGILSVVVPCARNTSPAGSRST